MDLSEVLLPGVGLRYEFTTSDGQRIGIVAHRGGDFEFVSYPEADPDEVLPLFRVTAEEAEVITELLGAPRIAERFADLTREVPGLSSGQVKVPARSPFAGRTLGETRARTRTGTSIVAVVRGEQVITSPQADQVLRAGDILVAIGAPQGIAGVEQILAG